MVRRGTAVAGG